MTNVNESVTSAKCRVGRTGHHISYFPSASPKQPKFSTELGLRPARQKVKQNVGSRRKKPEK